VAEDFHRAGGDGRERFVEKENRDINHENSLQVAESPTQNGKSAILYQGGSPSIFEGVIHDFSQQITEDVSMPK
jgi:hypothetical protein